MIRRLLAVTGVAATLLSASFAAAPAATAAPGDPNQVALFVQYPDGTSRQWCVRYSTGMTGADVLAAATPTYGTGPYTGFVLKITGKGTVPPTTTNYWAYWTTGSGGGLEYSGSGVTSTHPNAGTVEAWHWNSDGNQSKPQPGSYASLCPGGFASTPAPATTPASTPTRVAAPSGSGGGAGGATAPGGDATAGTGTTAGSGAGTGTGGTRTPGSTGSAAPTGSATPGVTPAPDASSTTRGSAGADAATSVAASNVAVTDDGGGLGAGPTVGLLAVGAAAVAFGVLAVVARRRRAEED